MFSKPTLAPRALGDFFASTLSSSDRHDLSLADAADGVVFPKSRLFVAKHRWSLPVRPIDMLAMAEETAGDVVIAREMRDRDPFNAVRWDLAMWIVDTVWVYHGCRLSVADDRYPRFLTNNAEFFIEVGPHGLRPGLERPSAPATDSGLLEANRWLFARPAGAA